MKNWGTAVCLGLAALLSLGCSAATRHRVLSVFFDGVPPPASAEEQAAKEAAKTGTSTSSRQATYSSHGPYAAKMCDACHSAEMTNALIAPKDQLCNRCHDLTLDKTYVHGPLASGGCLVCHDPHSSKYRYLLVSDADSFCFHCHDPQDVARVEAHGGAPPEQCTACHDAHMSDQKYLLK